MRYLKFGMVLPLGLAAGAADASGFCNGGNFYGSHGGWHGVRCDLLQSTQPDESPAAFAGDQEIVNADAGGGSKDMKGDEGDGGGGPVDDIPGFPIAGPARAAFSDLDLRPYYPAGGSAPLEFVLDVADLNLVGPDASVSLLQLGLQAPLAFTESHNCGIDMSVGYGSRGRYLQFLWTCQDVDGTSQSSWTTASLDPASTNLEVLLVPENADWKRLHVFARETGGSAGRDLDFDNGRTFSTPAASPLPRFQPASLRAGVIAGSIQRAGMTTRWQFFSPGIVD